jgi:hypothetical protein
MDEVQETAFTEYNAPSSEPFRLHVTSEIVTMSKLHEG